MELGSVAELCGGLPLALRVAGDFIRIHENWPLPKYITALQDEGTRLKRLRGNTADRDVEAVLALSARELVREDPESAARWQMLTVFPTQFDAEATAMVCELLDGDGRELDLEAADDALTALMDRSLVQYDTRFKRYSLHDLMRPVAREVFSYGVDHPFGRGSRERLNAAAARYTEYFTAMLKVSDPEYMDRVVKRVIALMAEKEAARGGTGRPGPVVSLADQSSWAGRQNDASAASQPTGISGSTPGGDSREEAEMQDLLKQTLMMRDFSTVLRHITSLPDGDARKNELMSEFATGMLSFFRRAIEFADKKARVNGDVLTQWRVLAAQPAMGDLYWFIAQYQAAQSNWDTACKFGERARASLQIHKPTELPGVDSLLGAWRAKLPGAPAPH